MAQETEDIICPCLDNIPDICPDHSIHHNNLVSSGTDELPDPEMLRNMRSVTVCTVEYSDTNCCQWNGCCFLDYICIENGKYVVCDGLGIVYRYLPSVIEAYRE